MWRKIRPCLTKTCTSIAPRCTLPIPSSSSALRANHRRKASSAFGNFPLVIRFPPASLQRVNNFNESLLQLIEGRAEGIGTVKHRDFPVADLGPSSPPHPAIGLLIYTPRVSLCPRAGVQDGRRKVHAIRVFPECRTGKTGFSGAKQRSVFF